MHPRARLSVSRWRTRPRHFRSDTSEAPLPPARGRTRAGSFMGCRIRCAARRARFGSVAMSPGLLAGLPVEIATTRKEWSMTVSATSISEVGAVFVPVADQDRSLEFFVEKLGFEKRADFAYGGQHRWIEVAPARARRTRSRWSRRVRVHPRAATWPAARSRRPTSMPTTRPCAPEASTSTRRSRGRARRGRDSSQTRCPSRIRFRRSSSSAIPTATASWSSRRAEVCGDDRLETYRSDLRALLPPEQ